MHLHCSTFVGTFEPSDTPSGGSYHPPGYGGYGYGYDYRSIEDEDAPVVQLLNKEQGNQATAASAILRMNERFVFRGKFLPDSKVASSVGVPATEDLRSTSNTLSLAGEKGDDDKTADVSAPGSRHVLRLSDDEGPIPRDREARAGAPGSPGGE